MRDVAKLARVSAKTGSRVINREGSAREETRDRVLQAIEQLNHRPDLSARSLSGARAYSTGLVCGNPNPCYAMATGSRGTYHLLKLAKKPAALFGANDEVASEPLAATRASTVAVPSLSVAGFEDNPFSRHSWASLTTSRQRTALIAEHARRLLIAQIHGNDVENEGFSPELVVRGSTAPPRPRP